MKWSQPLFSDDERAGFGFIVSGLGILFYALVLLPAAGQMQPGRFPPWVRTMWLIVGGILIVGGVILGRRK